MRPRSAHGSLAGETLYGVLCWSCCAAVHSSSRQQFPSGCGLTCLLSTVLFCCTPQPLHAAAPGGPVLSALCDPHPALQLLLAVDVPATITVLAEATAGWDAVETDLRTAAGKPTTELESVLVATQVSGLTPHRGWLIGSSGQHARA